MELLSPWSESVELSDTIVGAVRAPKNFQEEISRCLVKIPEEVAVALVQEAAEASEVPDGAEAREPVVVRRPLVKRRECALPSVGMSSTMETKQPPISSRPRGRS